MPVENQTRTYWWCSPPRIERQRMCPARLTARDSGASLSKDRCVRVSFRARLRLWPTSIPRVTRPFCIRTANPNCSTARRAWHVSRPRTERGLRPHSARSGCRAELSTRWFAEALFRFARSTSSQMSVRNCQRRAASWRCLTFFDR